MSQALIPTKEKYRIDDYPAVRDVILELVMRKKFDATDLLIIAERDCSPMPTMRDVAMRIGIGLGTVSRRVERIERLIAKNIPAD